VTNPERQRKSSPTFELALRGLQNMGFAKAEARRALEHISERHAGRRNGDALEAPDLLRGALAILTSATRTKQTASSAR
jgi:Holliday junction resolvasome RuvABC DNA-binding subunit